MSHRATSSFSKYRPPRLKISVHNQQLRPSLSMTTVIYNQCQLAALTFFPKDLHALFLDVQVPPGWPGDSGCLGTTCVQREAAHVSKSALSELSGTNRLHREERQSISCLHYRLTDVFLNGRDSGGWGTGISEAKPQGWSGCNATGNSGRSAQARLSRMQQWRLRSPGRGDANSQPGPHAVVTVKSLPVHLQLYDR